MKKLLGISVIAMLAVAPAFAVDGDPVPGAPTHLNSGTTITGVPEPEFALVGSNAETDGNAASAGYVKGAYNAAIKAINKVNAKQTTSAGNGIAKSDAGVISVTAKSDGGIAVDSNGVAVDYGTTLDMTGTAGSKKLDVKAGGIGTTQLADSAVTTAKIADGNVTADKLATDSVTTAKIADGNVTTAKLDAGAVTTAKIADANVTHAKLATDAVEAANIKDGEVTLSKVAADAKQGATNTSTYSGTKLTTSGYVDEKVATATTGMATQAGVEATIKNTSISVTDNKTVALGGSITGANAGTITIMTDWTDPTATTTHNYIGGINNALTVSLGGTITAAVDDSTVSYSTTVSQ